MPKFHVHVYAVVRVLVPNIEADSQIEACEKADEMVDMTNLFGHVPFRPPVASVEFADEINGFLVDEDGDTEHEKSTSYDAEYRPRYA